MLPKYNIIYIHIVRSESVMLSSGGPRDFFILKLYLDGLTLQVNEFRILYISKN